jgi:glutamyl-tRNA reductase
MPILALGVSYRRAGVELLERLSFVPDDLPKAYRALVDEAEINEAVLLSTCNRVEVYAGVGSYHAGFLALKRVLTESREVTPEELAEPLYSHYEDDAAEHLFEVAAGLDSMVLGEPQILSQVREAFRAAEAEGTVGPLVSALFRGAIRTGKRARAETAIGAAPDTMVRAGVDLAERSVGGLADRSALVVGAGGMADLAARRLRERGVSHLRILNRSVERARRLAARTGGEPGGLDVLAAAIARADVVVSSTGAAGLLVSEADVRRALRAKPDGAHLFVLDLAVPRDVDPAVASLPGVDLADIDDLKQAVEPGLGGARTEIDAAREIVGEEVRRFTAWRRAARLAPLIEALRARGVEARDAERVRLAAKLSGLDAEERAAVEALVEGVVAKLLHRPIARLKQVSGPGEGDALARALAELFDIPFRPGA